MVGMADTVNAAMKEWEDLQNSNQETFNEIQNLDTDLAQ